LPKCLEGEVRLLVGLCVDLSLGPVTGVDLALEKDVDLTVRAVLHLWYKEVCQDEADETSSSPYVTALSAEVGFLFDVSNVQLKNWREILRQG
jgi:hypothetical protein